MTNKTHFDKYGMYKNFCPYSDNCEYEDIICLNEKVHLRNYHDCPFYKTEQRKTREDEKRRPSFLDLL
jgi:hypothetical protein